MKIDAATMDTLRALKIEGNRVVITEKLDRKSYTRVNEVLATLGGKWTRKVAAHVFASDPAPLIAGVLDTGTVETDADMGFFPTPPKVGTALVEFIDPYVGAHTWLEPSAGDGQLAMSVKTLCVASRMTLVELHVGRAEALREIFPNERVILADFLQMGPKTPDFEFDYVAMNPPFDKRGIHMEHVRHAFERLKPGGTLGAILPSGVRDRDDRKHADFRAWVESHNGTWRDLPPLSFRASGTDVNTTMLRMERAR
jgi:predicted RNA methylase